ncbi:MAG: translesion DNA synthesis-associated protein ImuA [Polaromonas sp.]|uniref:translesion DNA synthesis-associated protein ImuA n=1 Tax=Polaromonas sp. TaxID=1869339 RepID=UPI002487B0BD|nr:translesion DNA synthesis-associated protein ImuA [Polaromonas sp.]MDI1271052.1 translesion DNA synthesis-associated protein ImuA [Polaromonas sp.]
MLPLSSVTPASPLPPGRSLDAMPAGLAQHADVWRAAELGSHSLPALDTGYAPLNQVLPGGGWPQGALVEMLQPQAGLHEWGLLLPALAAVQAAAPAKLVVLVGAPWLPFGPALGARQLNMQRVLCVHSQGPALLWATREALQCADVAAVLAWLPDARSAHLRRLQMAAHAHSQLLFVFRPLRAQLESSPAPLRLLLEGAAAEEGNLRVHVLKRRGPPLAAPLLLATRPARLSALLAASRERVRRRREEAGVLLPRLQPAQARVALVPGEDAHALLDRIANSHHH